MFLWSYVKDVGEKSNNAKKGEEEPSSDSELLAKVPLTKLQVKEREKQDFFSSLQLFESQFSPVCSDSST